MKIAVGCLLLLATLVQCRFRTRPNCFWETTFYPPVLKSRADICHVFKGSNRKTHMACKRIIKDWQSCDFLTKIMEVELQALAVAARHIFDHACAPGATFRPEMFTTQKVTTPMVTPPEDNSPPGDFTCGQSPVLRRREPLMNVGGIGRIVGGEDAKGCSTLPWLVQINADNMLCGGSIISPNHVLTAAHCVDHVKNDLQKVIIRAADYDMHAKEEKIVGVSKIVVHERYTNNTDLRSDIALLTLNETLQYSKCVAPICLDRYFTPNGGYCVVAGWGHDRVFGKIADVLQMVRERVYKGSECAEKFDTFFDNYVKDPTSTICGGYSTPGMGTCHGDSGGPLVCWRNGRYVQAGVVSYGQGCAWAKSPTVYTSVPYYHDWITDKMNRRFYG